MTTDGRQLQLLLAWMSPAFPIGGFAYSHGLEFAIEDRQVTDAGSLRQWIEDVLTHGSGWNDAVLFARSWEDDAEELNELALALAGSRERYVETTSLGNAFLQAAATWTERGNSPLPLRERGRDVGSPRGSAATIEATAEITKTEDTFLPPPLSQPEADDFAASSRAGDPSPPAPSPSRGEGDLAYPVAAGRFCFAAAIDRNAALLAYLQGFASTLISVAVRLIPLGQTQGLAVLRDLMPVIAATAARAETAALEDLGSATLGADIAAMKHDTQYSRVFRT